MSTVFTASKITEYAKGWILTMEKVLAGGTEVPLYQSSFGNGSVIVGRDFYQVTEMGVTTRHVGSTKNLVFRLMEDVEFDPNPPATNDADALWDSGKPTAAQHASGDYPADAFGIGFFAALVVYGKDVAIDLNGYMISQGARHALLQRFFSVVELADRPFIPKQGPHDFGAHISSAENVGIFNGTIGRSSHHCVHGNNVRNVVVKNVDLVGYEVAGFHVNGSLGVVLHSVSMSSSTAVPVLGAFSGARFIQPYVDACVAAGHSVNVGGTSKSAAEVRDALKTAVFNVYADLITSGLPSIRESTNTLKEWSLFHNPTGVVDGNAYGFAVNGKGVAVLGFPEDRSSVTNVVYLYNVVVKDQLCRVNEVPALLSYGGGGSSSYSAAPIMNDPVGALFQVQNVDANGDLVTIDGSGGYVGNPLSDAQVLVASGISSGVDFGSLSTKRNSIDSNALDFAAGTKTLHTDLGGGWALGTFAFNGDSMFHVNKGCIGFKVDASENVVLDNCRMYNVSNSGGLGLTQGSLPVPVATSADREGYYDRLATSHPDATYGGYGGAHARGISMASSKNVHLINSEVVGVVSEAGPAIGIDMHQSTSDVYVTNVRVTGVSAGAGVTGGLVSYRGNPTPPPTATGIHVDKEVEAVRLANVKHLGHGGLSETYNLLDKCGGVTIL